MISNLDCMSITKRTTRPIRNFLVQNQELHLSRFPKYKIDAGNFRAKKYWRYALDPMLITLAGMVIEVKFEAPENALAPILVILELASNVNEVKLDAPENALDPMLVTLAGMVMEVKLAAPENAFAPMVE